MALTLSMTAISPASCAEHELIDAARRGDDRAFEELYARYRERITAFIAGRVGDYGRAEDIAQEVFMAALRRLRATEQKILFKPWIYEIAKNACIDEYRRTRRSHEVSLDVELDEHGPRPLLSLAPPPPQAVENRQKLTDLTGAFGGLSESHHQLLVLREFEGRSYEEIGAQTGMSRQMVESALFRARRKLTEEYNELASGRRCQQVQAAIDDGRAMSVRSFGVRERRQFARHLAHCQACRAAAHLAGVDDGLLAPRRIGAKIAALLPFPLLRWPLRAPRSSRALSRAGSHAGAVHSVAAVAQPAGPAAFGGAVVAAAVLALGGAGVGAGSAAAGHVHRAPIAVLPTAGRATATPSSAASSRPAHPLAGFTRMARVTPFPASIVRSHRSGAHRAGPAASSTGGTSPASKGRAAAAGAPATASSAPLQDPTAPIVTTAGQAASGATNAITRTVSSTIGTTAKGVSALPVPPPVTSAASTALSSASSHTTAAADTAATTASQAIKSVTKLLGS